MGTHSKIQLHNDGLIKYYMQVAIVYLLKLNIMTKHHIFSYGQFIKLYLISKFGLLVYPFCALSASISQQIQNMFLSSDKVTT